MKRPDIQPANFAGNPIVSVVVPVFNERTMLPVFLDRVLPILDSLTVDKSLS